MACKQKSKEVFNHSAQKQQMNQTSMVVIKELQETVNELKTTMNTGFKKLEIKMLDINTAGQKQLLQIIDLLKLDLKDKIKEIQEKFSGTLDAISLQMQTLKKEMEEVKEVNHVLGVRIDKLEKDNLILRQQLDNQEQEKILSQFRIMEYAVRIRGVKEDDHPNPQQLQELCAQNLSAWTGMDKAFLFNSFEKVYRVNSRVAKEKNLPRDIVVYFDRKKIRNKVCQSVFNKKLQYAGLEVILMKEIPPKMLLQRKEFSFLTKELRRRGYLYRWDLPIGLVVSYLGQRHCLNTLDKAKAFYTQMVKEGHQGRVEAKDGHSQQEVSAILSMDGRSVKQEDKPEEEIIQQQDQLQKRSDGFEDDSLDSVTSTKEIDELTRMIRASI